MMRANLVSLVLGAWVGSMLVAGCGQGDSSDLDRQSNKADQSGVSATERRAILDAIHSDFLDKELHGQPNELVVEWIHASGMYAFVTASVQKKGGGEINWEDSEYATALKQGIFDPPGLWALLIKAETWTVIANDIGPTDVSWEGLWWRWPVPSEIFPGNMCPTVTEPQAGAPEREAIMEGIHQGFLDANLHQQPNELMVSFIRSSGDFAFVQATVQKKGGGEIDWTNTEYRAAVQEGLFDGPSLSALLKRAEGAWTVLEEAVGATDVSWWGAWERHSDVPCALFPVEQCTVAQ